MLTYLNIKNFALIENCEIEFTNGLNIISGETGSGKSILIQALAILLGHRASTDQIRGGQDEAILNGTITLSQNHPLKERLRECGIDTSEGDLILRRILTISGKSRSFINGTQVTSKELELVSSYLFDFHGQHDGVSLLKKQTHIGYLDNYIGIDKELSKIKSIYEDIKRTEESLRFVESSQKDKEKRVELLKYEITEIEDALIKDNEDIELKKEIKILENIEKLLSSLNDIQTNLTGENGLLFKLKSIKNLFNNISEMDSYFTDKTEIVSDIYYKLEDIEGDITSKLDSYQFEPQKLDKLIDRSELIEKLKRKYGESIESIKEYHNKAKKDLESINFSEEKKEQLLIELKELRSRYIELAILISKKRREGAIEFAKKVKEESSYLGMDKVDFKVKVEVEESDSNYLLFNNKKLKYKDNGVDDVEFLISPNQGEPLKPLLKIASGGELSRIILSLKTVLAQNDDVETMIFDEIDVGIGGKVALSVAKTLKKISISKQLICITHLPQIAAIGTKNFVIQKNIVSDRTVTNLTALNKDEKIGEIARMLSGHITETSINHARELIEKL